MFQCNQSSPSSEYTSGTGSNQSPINIDTFMTIPRVYPPIVISGHAELLTRNMTLINTGHTVEIRHCFDSPGAFLCGGPLRERFKFFQLHFHWGSTDLMGSEHSINGNFYSMEAHFVHYNEKYQNMEESIRKPDGLAVIAIFLQVKSEDDQDDPEIARITNYLPSARMAGTTMDILPGVLAWVEHYCFSCRQYYTYNGSLTTSPFTENVIWLVYPIPVEVSKRQIDLFRHLNNSVGGNITSNHRQTQLLCGRPVYLAQDTFVQSNEYEDHEGQVIMASTVNNAAQMSSSV